VAERIELSPSRVRTDDWPAQATDTIVRVVGTASTKVTGPVTTAARALVFGLFAAILGMAALVLLTIMAVRVLDIVLPDKYVGKDHVWLAHLIIGMIFCGLALWARSQIKSPEE
jgi:hypothetical protein